MIRESYTRRKRTGKRKPERNRNREIYTGRVGERERERGRERKRERGKERERVMVTWSGSARRRSPWSYLSMSEFSIFLCAFRLYAAIFSFPPGAAFTALRTTNVNAPFTPVGKV